MKYNILDAIISAALSASNQLADYPDAVALAQDVLQEREDNNELQEFDAQALTEINSIIHMSKYRGE